MLETWDLSNIWSEWWDMTWPTNRPWHKQIQWQWQIQLENTDKGWSWRPVTLATCDPLWKLITFLEFWQLRTTVLTFIVILQLGVTLDSIHNSCDIFGLCPKPSDPPPPVCLGDFLFSVALHCSTTEYALNREKRSLQYFQTKSPKKHLLMNSTITAIKYY